MKHCAAILLALTLSLPALAADGKKLTIMHTNDMHSHLLGLAPELDYSPEITGNDATRGGFARLAAVINETRRSRQNPVLLLDAGDFVMGSIFHMLTREESFELRIMKQMGYDAVTLGNHEFDLKPAGLARIIDSGLARGGIPSIIASNLVFTKDDPRDAALRELYRKNAMRPYQVVERGGLRIGMFGIMGHLAVEESPFAKPLTFSDQIETARRMVKILREQEKVDLVVFISHCGIWQVKKYSEDENIAAAVSGIDIIVGGHSHIRLDKPIVAGTTIIVQAGEYGKCLGVLDVTVKGGKVTLDRYRLVDIDDSIRGDAVISATVEQYKKTIAREILAPWNLTPDSILAHTDFDLTDVEEESGVGNLVTDAGRWYINRHLKGEHVDVMIDSNGLIRGDLPKGKTGRISVSDYFRVISLGIGMDEPQTMGYPYVTAWVYPHEIKKCLEVLTSIHPIKGPSFYIQVSGLKFRYNPHRVIFDRVTDIWMEDGKGGFEPLDYSTGNKKLHLFAANIYNASFLKILGDFTMGILTIVPKDRSGRPIANLVDARVDADPVKPGVQELKQWVGVMEYLRSFPDTNGDGLPDVPERYARPQGRIQRAASWNPYHLLRGGTWVTWCAAGLILLVGAGLTAGGVFVVRRVRR